MGGPRNIHRRRKDQRDAQAYNDGRASQRSGQALSSNPFKRGTVQSREWSAGWRKAAKGADKDQADPWP